MNDLENLNKLLTHLPYHQFRAFIHQTFDLSLENLEEEKSKRAQRQKTRIALSAAPIDIRQLMEDVAEKIVLLSDGPGQDVLDGFRQCLFTDEEREEVEALSNQYFNIWPIILREHRERWVDELDVRFPPSPEAVDRMVETNRWALWLEEEQRHLIWMRAQRCKWKEICARFGCERSTARRRWERALKVVVERLNDQQTVDSKVEGESNNS